MSHPFGISPMMQEGKSAIIQKIIEFHSPPFCICIYLTQIPTTAVNTRTIFSSGHKRLGGGPEGWGG